MRTPASNCRRCPRLVALRRQVRRDYPDYHAAPVPVFGPPDAPLLVVGLAPGMHGANATGRAFTGDVRRYFCRCAGCGRSREPLVKTASRHIIGV